MLSIKWPVSDCLIIKLQYKTNFKKSEVQFCFHLELGLKEEMKEECLSQHILFKNDKLLKLLELNVRL